MEPFELEKECTKAQQEGAPVPITAASIEDGGPYFIVRRMGTKTFRDEIAEIRKEKEAFFNLRSAFDEHDLYREWLWRYGVTGWSSDIMVDGKPLEFSMGMCKQFVTDEANMYYVNNIIAGAQGYENYLQSTLADVALAIKKRSEGKY